MQQETYDMEGDDNHDDSGGSDVGEEVAHQFSPIFGAEAPFLAENDAMHYQVPLPPSINT